MKFFNSYLLSLKPSDSFFRNSMTLSICLLLFLSSSINLFAQTTTYTFANRDRTNNIQLSVNSQPRTTISKGDMKSLTLNIGDVVTVSVKGKPELTWYQIYITERTPKINPIIINPEVIWFANDSRAINTPILNYYFNTKGIHIHNYNPRIVAESFNSTNIFEGISKESLDYIISDDGEQLFSV